MPINPRGKRLDFYFGVIIAILVISFICICLASLVSGVSYREESKPTELNLIQGNSLIAISAPYIPDTIVHGALLDCLSREESSSNLKVKGDKGYDCNNVLFPSEYCAFGCLQYWQTTWKGYCMDIYGFTAQDIWDCEKQYQCADKMLKDNIDNVGHWSTYPSCYHCF